MDAFLQQHANIDIQVVAKATWQVYIARNIQDINAMNLLWPSFASDFLLEANSFSVLISSMTIRSIARQELDS